MQEPACCFTKEQLQGEIPYLLISISLRIRYEESTRAHVQDALLMQYSNPCAKQAPAMFIKKAHLVVLVQGIALTIAISTSCQSGFTICSPPGATSSETPTIGNSEFTNLYVDLLRSSLPSFKRTSVQGTASLCCISSLSCLSVTNLGLPFCYDKFTTNFYLPDASFGTLSNGSYTSASGDTANLQTGQFTLSNGTEGNIYNNPSEVPNIASLPVPTQYTASGVGSIIPASALGGEVTLTYTTTFPASTIPGTTVPGSTLFGMDTRTILFPVTITTTISGSAEPGIIAITSLEFASTPTGTALGTTVEAKTIPKSVATFTMTQVGVSSPTASKKSEGAYMGRYMLGGIWLSLWAVWLTLC